MTKKEKVIKGLKCCIEDYSCVSTEDHHPDCPYWEADNKEIVTGCMRRLFDDAIDVLESEEESRPEINPNCNGLGYANCEICDSYCPYR